MRLPLKVHRVDTAQPRFETVCRSVNGLTRHDRERHGYRNTIVAIIMSVCIGAVRNAPLIAVMFQHIMIVSVRFGQCRLAMGLICVAVKQNAECQQDDF